jgi:hypothetical protein
MFFMKAKSTARELEGVKDFHFIFVVGRSAGRAGQVPQFQQPAHQKPDLRAMSDRIKKAVKAGDPVALESLLESDLMGLNQKDFVCPPHPLRRSQNLCF